MATYVPAKRATAYKFYVGLIDQSNTKLLKANPTIASGDFKVSIDGGAFANLATLPSANPASGRAVMIDLSGTEMTGDSIVVQCVDAAGAEWCDLMVSIQTAARQIDDLAYPATSGRSLAVDASGRVDVGAVLGTAQTAGDLKASMNTLQADTDDIQTRLPAALVSGRMDSSLGAIAVGVDLSATMKTSVTTAATAATPTAAAVTGAVGSVTGNVGGNVVGSVASVTAAVSVNSNVKKNSASAGFTFVMTDSTNHAPATGLTITATRSIDGAAFGACTNAAAELSNGAYKIDLAAADVNGNHIMLRFTSTAADDRFIEIITDP